MKKKTDYITIMWALLSFVIASFIMFFFVNKISSSEGISVFFLESIESQLRDINELRSTFNRGRIFIPEAFCDILTDHLYPSFILGLLFAKASDIIIKVFFYLRFGLCAFTLNLLCTKTFKLDYLWASILSLAYAFSSISLAASKNPLLLNFVIVLPLIAISSEEALRKKSPQSFWKACFSFSLLCATGFLGIINGIIFVLLFMWILKGLVPNSSFKAGLLSLGVSIIPMMLVILPTIVSGLRRINIVSAFKNGNVPYTTFDLFTSFFDGIAITLPPDAKFAPMGLSLLVLVLVLLFFFNDAIPFKGKQNAFFSIVILLVSCASSTVSEILSVFGYETSGAFMRQVALGVILMVLACISVKNINLLNRNKTYLAAFILLAVICISNVGSASEVSKTSFYLYFSASAVIYWCSCLCTDILKDYRKLILVIMIGVIGLCLNLYQVLKVSSFAGSLETPVAYEMSSSKTNLDTISDDLIPLCGNDEYIAVDEDLRTNSVIYFPELINRMSNSLLLQDVYTNANAFCVFSSGVIDNGDSTYSAITIPTPVEILVRCEGMNPGSDYFVYSSFMGDTAYVDETSGDGLPLEFTSPFMRKLNKGLSTTLRFMGEPTNQTGSFSIWQENKDAMEEFKSHINNMDDYSFMVNDNPMSRLPNLVTVMTSIPYSSRYGVDVYCNESQVDASIVNICGKLAIVYQGDGVSDYSVRINSSYTVLLISISLWLIAMSVITYKMIKKNNITIKEEVDVK